MVAAVPGRAPGAVLAGDPPAEAAVMPPAAATAARAMPEMMILGVA
jgi:hypothetical protein